MSPNVIGRRCGRCLASRCRRIRTWRSPRYIKPAHPSADPSVMPPFALLLPAAGKSVRYGAGRSKLLEPLAGRPVLAHALTPFLGHPALVRVVIPTGEPAGMRDIVFSALGRSDDRITFCPGGDSRAASVRAGLQRVP